MSINVKPPRRISSINPSFSKPPQEKIFHSLLKTRIKGDIAPMILDNSFEPNSGQSCEPDNSLTRNSSLKISPDLILSDFASMQDIFSTSDLNLPPPLVKSGDSELDSDAVVLPGPLSISTRRAGGTNLSKYRLSNETTAKENNVENVIANDQIPPVPMPRKLKKSALNKSLISLFQIQLESTNISYCLVKLENFYLSIYCMPLNTSKYSEIHANNVFRHIELQMGSISHDLFKILLSDLHLFQIVESHMNDITAIQLDENSISISIAENMHFKLKSREEEIISIWDSALNSSGSVTSYSTENNEQSCTDNPCISEENTSVNSSESSSNNGTSNKCRRPSFLEILACRIRKL